MSNLKRKTIKHTKNRNRLTDTETRLTVARGDEGGKMGEKGERD